jgi:hypothetical protein
MARRRTNANTVTANTAKHSAADQRVSLGKSPPGLQEALVELSAPATVSPAPATDQNTTDKTCNTVSVSYPHESEKLALGMGVLLISPHTIIKLAETDEQIRTLAGRFVRQP